jgi:hypothetical protein
MPAAVEQHGDQAAFMAADGEPAWHGLGTVVSEAVKAEEALRLAHLNDWNVHKVRIAHHRVAGHVHDCPHQPVHRRA